MSAVKPAPRTLVSTPVQLVAKSDDALVQQLLDAVHELNGRIHFLQDQLALVAAAVPVTIDTLAD